MQVCPGCQQRERERERERLMIDILREKKTKTELFIISLEYAHSAMQMINVRKNNRRFRCVENIPQPKDVLPIERKSRRTVRLKWNGNRLNQMEPVFYVIEAQWTLPKTAQNQEEIVSKWGFVKEEVSHPKAIIRNIQRDNRWYRFRVAAVTRHGYSPFSTTTEPFRLSSNAGRIPRAFCFLRKEFFHSVENEGRKSLAKIPPPRNFLVKDSPSSSNRMNVTLSWQAPNFPVNGYQVTISRARRRECLFSSI